jgi:surfeit locus 1 family protein
VTHAASLPNAAPRRAAGRLALAGLCLALLALFLALGVWQVERRAWKLDLIERVEARVHAPAAAMPGPAAWSGFDAGAQEYRRVTATGRYLPGRDALVQAVTERGAGHWLLSPFRTEAGFVVLVNRGFVAAGSRPPVPEGPATVTGLLRLTEPGGGFLRANDPGADRWYSRDVAAIARAKGVAAPGIEVAPYFVDADASGNGPGRPVGGLTVVAFRNAHLVYALTWFALAALSGFGLARVLAPGPDDRVR